MVVEPHEHIDTDAQLSRALEDLCNSEICAFDLEFDRDRHFYGFTLCLVQIASPTAIYLIDPMSEIDLRPLFDFFENERTLKIAHCPGEDIRLLHTINCFPKHLFDTEVCAKLLNYPRTSLGAMVETFFNITLDKNLQTSAWHHRPLSEAQLQYAAADVRYLIPMYKKLEEVCNKSAVKEYILQEQQLLNTEDKSLQKKENFLKKSDFRNYSPFDNHILNGLLTYRDALAEKRNRSPHFIFSDTAIRDLVENKENIEVVFQGKGIPNYMKSREWRYKWTRRIEKYCAEAEQLELSKSIERSQNGSRESGHKMREIKQSIFTPIQKIIADDLGENAVRYVFSTNTINELLRQNISISDLKPQYRQDLVKNAAKKLGADISEYL